MANIVFIATSLDGYIADKSGGLDWLNMVPNPDNIDMGFMELMNRVDALLMGRNTFETVCSFDIEWPYSKPVFVLSNTLNNIPEKYKNKAELVNGPITEIVSKLNHRGFMQLYIDGGKTIRSFLQHNLIDELVITKIPVLLGGGTSLFHELPKEIKWKHIVTQVFLDEIVQSRYSRVR